MSITREELNVLEQRWGKQRCLDTMIFLERQKDHRGVMRPAEVSAERIEAVHRVVMDDPQDLPEPEPDEDQSEEGPE